jgi:hypothetical protein
MRSRIVSGVPISPYEPMSPGKTIGAQAGIAARASSSLSPMMQYDMEVRVIEL